MYMTAGFLRKSLVIVVAALSFRCISLLAQSATEQRSRIDRLSRQAEADLRDQKLDLAEAEFRELLASDPENTNAHSNLGLTYYLRQQFAPAAEQFNIALRAKPDLWNIAALCGLSEARIQKNANAAVHLEQAFDHVADPSLRLAVGKQLFSILSTSGDLDRASEIVTKLEQLQPNNPDLLYAAHRVYSLLANRAFLQLAYQEPDSARMYQVWGDRMKLAGDARGAVVAYRKAIERDPDLSGIHTALGDVLSASSSASDRTGAEEQYKKALLIDPSDARAESRLGDLAVERSAPEEASEHYRRALQIQPDNADANDGLGIALMQSQSYVEARTYLSRAVQLDPTNRVAYYNLSLVSRRLGDVDAANSQMAEFLKLKAEDESMRRSFSSMKLGPEAKMPQSVDAAPKAPLE